MVPGRPIRGALIGCLICGMLWMGADRPEKDPQNGSQALPVREIRMIARNWVFEPDTVYACPGQRVRLIIDARDKTHGIQIQTVKVKVKLPRGRTTIVEFTAPERPGTYPFKCWKYCGKGHKKMRGRLIVTACTTPSPDAGHSPMQ